MAEGNGVLAQGIFQGRVLEALDMLKNAKADNTEEHRRLFERIEEVAEELASRKSNARASAAKTSGIMMGCWATIQGLFWLLG